MQSALPGYDLDTCIYESSRSRVYRATQVAERRPVILKLLKPECLETDEPRHYEQEYEMTRRLSSAEVVRVYELIRHSGRPVLVFEDCGGRSLDYWLKCWGRVGESLFPVDQFIRIASKIVDGLAEVHAAGAIHKNIASPNIIYNPRTEELKLIDFGMATLLPRETTVPCSPYVLEGTLAYLSPEQTGRMNRTIDYRSDFYSLGVMLYELSTGQLPFEVADTLELIHSHLARRPESPSLLNPAVPAMLSKLVLKLLSKDPEDRYQSSRGLRYDLDVCEQQWRLYQRISDFQLGSQDRSERLNIPEKLYGRAAEIDKLLASFERVVAGQPELVLVTGASGIGKTAIINEVHIPIVARRGYFVEGKFDQFTQNAPFAALVQAFRSLMSQLLDDKEHLPRWQSVLQDAVGEGGQVIIDLVPELELLIGPQTPVPALSGSAIQNRFNVLFSRFVRAFARSGHPLVIVLDDLQWADQASLDLLRTLLGDIRSGQLLIVGAFRDNEVASGHPLAVMLDALQGDGVVTNKITLRPLHDDDVNQLIADALDSEPKAVAALNEATRLKAQGNPLFTQQFLKLLQDKGLIFLNPATRKWSYDIARINAGRTTGDVIAFMAERIASLPAVTQTALTTAACIGNHFDLETLSVGCGVEQTKVAAALWPAIQENLVVPLDKQYVMYLLELGNQVSTRGGAPEFRFVHDRVQQAAYSQLTAEKRARLHHTLGRQLIERISERELAEKVFEIANHLNLGTTYLHDDGERLELARVNLLAGRRAKDATAYKTASSYFQSGIALLSEDDWGAQYRLSLELHEGLAEVTHLLGDVALLEEHASVVFKRARDLLDKIKTYEVLIESRAANAQYRAAVEIGLEVLEMLGVEVPAERELARVGAALNNVREKYKSADTSRLLELPAMSDRGCLSAMRILMAISAPAYLWSPITYVLIILKQLELIERHGNTPASCFCFASVGLILCGKAGDYDLGYSFGRLSLDVLDVFDSKELEARVICVAHAFTLHWKSSLKDILRPLQRAYQKGLEVGDLQFAWYSIYFYYALSYYAGLESSIPVLRDSVEEMIQSKSLKKQELMNDSFLMLRQSLHDIEKGRPDAAVLRGEYFDEPRKVEEYRKLNNINSLFFLNLHKLVLNYLLGNYEQALIDASASLEYEEGVTGQGVVLVRTFLDSLVCLAQASEASEQARLSLMKRVEGNQALMLNWAKLAPMNCLYKYELVEAEVLRLAGEPWKAAELYDRAIAGARCHRYLRDEAIANELAARFYIEQKKTKIAKVYLQEAYEIFGRYGAIAKMTQMRRAYGVLLEAPEAAELRPESPVRLSVDMLTIVKAMYAIASEIELGRLLERMMRIVLANAGAERGALVLDRDDKWMIVARAEVQLDRVETTPINLLDADSVSPEIVLEVVRTRTAVIVDDIANQVERRKYPHFVSGKVKSVLAAPLINQGRLGGVIYLENNLTTHAFTQERLEVVDLLAMQMALSLDNAGLYAAVQAELEERKAAELALRNSENRFRTIFDSFNDAVFVQELESGRIIDVNQTACRMFGFTREELIGLQIGVLSSCEPSFTDDDAMEHIRRARENGVHVFEWRSKDREGRLFWIEVTLRIVDISGPRLLAAARDISDKKASEAEQKRLEAQLLHSQKLETVGRLAGGVAHDFNNMLTVILGNAELLRLEISKEDPLIERVDEIATAAQHSKEITNQLLAFSRKQIISPRPVNLNVLIDSTKKNLARLIGEHIDLRFCPDASLWNVLMDPTQVEQILVNLAVNARDAMPNGGKLTIETANQTLSEDDCREHPEFTPGRYVQLVVSDSGWGMDAATKEHIFEPFFTTKEVGKGTGLGLATVYGIVRQNGGFITVYSELDKGTTFRIFFAKLADDTSDALLPVAETVDEVPMGKGTILVVEDDRMVQDTVARLLEALGYEVLKAEFPSKAIELCKVAENRIDLLLTDVVMVEMSGPKLKEEIERIRPGMKVLFMSGYTNNVIVHHGLLEAGVQLIQKPVTRKDLATKVACLLGSSEPACAGCLRVDAHEDP